MNWNDTSRTAALILLLGTSAIEVVAAVAQAPGQLKPKESLRVDSAEAKGKAKAGPSLLTNGEIEEGRGTPAGWSSGARVDGVQYLWDKEVSHAGKASLCLKKTAHRYFPIAQWFQLVRLSGEPGRVKVGAWVKAERLTKATLDVVFLDGAERTLSHHWAASIGARKASDPPVTHDWKWYEDVVDLPAGTKRLLIAPQIYGPGTVWFDDIAATAVDGAAKELPAAERAGPARAKLDSAEVPSVERTAAGDAKKRYFQVGPAAKAAAPAQGYRLLVILPGGNGSADFNPFVRRIAENSLSPGYIVAQPVAIEWKPDQAKSVVWPTDADKLPGQKFSTEEYVEAVIADVRRTHKIDPRYVFVLGWSSGGPPTYALSFRRGSSVTGSFVAMSIFPKQRPDELGRAKGRAYYLLHSPQDFIPIRAAESARDALLENGAKVKLQTYEGGHGWRGDVFGNIRAGIRWLEEQQASRQGADDVGI